MFDSKNTSVENLQQKISTFPRWAMRIYSKKSRLFWDEGRDFTAKTLDFSVTSDENLQQKVSTSPRRATRIYSKKPRLFRDEAAKYFVMLMTLVIFWKLPG